MKERKETFLKEFREKYPDIKISPKVIDSGEKVWVSMTASAKGQYMSQVEKSLAEEFAHHEPYVKMIDMPLMSPQ